MTGHGSDGGAAWDVSFLRVGALATAGATAVAVPLVALSAGWPEAVGVLLGAAIVTGFFVVSGLAVAFAGRIGDALTLPAALLAFFVKALVIFAILGALPLEGTPDSGAVAWTVVVGALGWSVVQLRWVWTRQLYYVPPPVPAQVRAPERAQDDPDRPPTRD